MKIDKSIPAPRTTNKYPIHDMDVGDSIFEEGCNSSADSRVRLSAKKHGAKYGKKFTCRKVQGGVRIWRVE